jgi:hypothetical protein
MKSFYIFVIYAYIVGKNNMRLVSDSFNLLDVLSSLWKLRTFFSATVEPIKRPVIINLKVQ